jgi:hypothetical protein
MTFGPSSVDVVREMAFEMPFLPGNDILQPFHSDQRHYSAIPFLGNAFLQ